MNHVGELRSQNRRANLVSNDVMSPFGDNFVGIKIELLDTNLGLVKRHETAHFGTVGSMF